MFIYLRENLISQRPITKLARVRRKKQQNTGKQNTKEGSLHNNNNNNIK
jgi:hypothetical protein